MCPRNSEVLRCGLVAVAIACVPPARYARPAEHPLLPRELAAYAVTVRAAAGGEALVGSVREALAREGFRVVEHAPYRNDWALEVGSDGATARATLTSDDFFVTEVFTPLRDDARAAAARLAHDLARTEGVTDFVRNSGLPQQRFTPF